MLFSDLCKDVGIKCVFMLSLYAVYGHLQISGQTQVHWNVPE